MLNIIIFVVFETWIDDQVFIFRIHTNNCCNDSPFIYIHLSHSRSPPIYSALTVCYNVGTGNSSILDKIPTLVEFSFKQESEKCQSEIYSVLDGDECCGEK